MTDTAPIISSEMNDKIERIASYLEDLATNEGPVAMCANLEALDLMQVAVDDLVLDMDKDISNRSDDPTNQLRDHMRLEIRTAVFLRLGAFVKSMRAHLKSMGAVPFE